MLQVSNLCKAYGAQTLFDDATFTINSRERVGLVGRNGHGKSTLFKIILNEEHQDSGEIVCPNDYKIGHLSQHISFTKETVLKEACTGLPIKEGGWNEAYRAEAALEGLGFSREDFNMDPKLLSGGLQVRLNLVKLLVSEADLLLLDEPTNYLDIVSLRWLSNFLKSWPSELMLITHDRSFMDAVTTHTIGIHREKIKKVKGSTHKLYNIIAEEEENFEKTRQNKLKKREQTEAFIRRFRAKASKARQAQSKIKELEREGPLDELKEIRTLDFSFNSVPFPGKQVLKVESASFRYTTNTEYLFDDLNFTLTRGERLGIIGQNGKGKTTLLNVLAGELKLSSGKCDLSDHTEVGFFGQTNIERLDPDKTVEQEVLGVQPEGNRTLARSICGHMMFEGDLALKKISVLSGGEKSRVHLGKILVSATNLLLLDEPTNHLDMYSSEAFRDALLEYPGSIVLVTHDEELLRDIVTRLIIFDRGKAHFFPGTYDEFLEKIGWESEALSSAPGTNNKSIQNKKERRKQRAAELKERQAVIGPLEKEMKKIEKEIAKIEETISEQNQELLEGTIEGYSNEMAKLSRLIHQNKSRCNELYEELENIMLEIEEKDIWN